MMKYDIKIVGLKRVGCARVRTHRSYIVYSYACMFGDANNYNGSAYALGHARIILVQPTTRLQIQLHANAQEPG